MNALEFSKADLFAHNGSNGYQTKKAKKTVSKERGCATNDLPDGTYYEFTTPAGRVLYAQRHRGAYYRKIGEDRWEKGLEGVEQVLYNLPELVDGVRAGKTIHHGEGPKDAETARERLGVAATTSGGATSWKPEFRSFYTGVDVVVVPDNDNEGRKHAAEVAQSIAPVASRVRVVGLPGLPEKADLTDWLDAGHTPEEFFELVEAQPPYTPNNGNTGNAGNGGPIRATDLLAMDMLKVRWAVPGILPAGVALLAGKLKDGNVKVEMIRALRIARRPALNARTQSTNQLKALMVAAPEEFRARLHGLSSKKLVTTAARFRPGHKLNCVAVVTI